MIFTVNTYYETPNNDFKGNPLVTAFPQVDEEVISTLMENTVTSEAEERNHAPELRIQYAMRLLNFFLPLPHQVDFCLRLWSLIMYGYKQRHPFKQMTEDAFSLLMKEIATKVVKPCQDGTAFDAMLCALLIGTPGTGKSTSIKALLGRLGAGLLHHTKFGDMYQLLYISIQAPKSGTAKALAEDIFDALRKAALETGRPMPYTTGRMPTTEAQLTAAIVALAQKLHLGVLVLDELQHLFRGSESSDNDAMKFLTGVINRIGIPVLLVGTWECIGLLGLEARIARRATGPADSQFRRMQNDSEWRAFMDALFSHQFTQNVVEMDDDLCEAFYFHTQGVQDLAVKLMVISQIDEILEGTEMLTVDGVNASANRHMSLIGNVVRMLREGRRETDPTLWDLEPSDLDKYMKDFATRARISLKRSGDRKAMNAARKIGLVDSIAASLEATGGVGAEDADKLAQTSADQSPHLPAADHVAKILSEGTALAPRPTKSKSTKRQQEVSNAILAFDDLDLRRILFVTTQQTEDLVAVESAIQRAGHLCVLTDEFV